MFFTNRIRSQCISLNIMRQLIYLTTILAVLSTAFVSCSKEGEKEGEKDTEVTLLGNWISFNIDELGDLGRSPWTEGTAPTNTGVLEGGRSVVREECSGQDFEGTAKRLAWD